jgi:hypothetical protein
MTEFSFLRLSVTSSGEEYFQVSFEDCEGCEDRYFLIQRQFESDDGGLFYVESHERTLCGHFKIKKVELGRNMFRVELACEPAEIVRIMFQDDSGQYRELERVLKIMIPAGVLKIE